MYKQRRSYKSEENTIINKQLFARTSSTGSAEKFRGKMPMHLEAKKALLFFSVFFHIFTRSLRKCKREAVIAFIRQWFIREYLCCMHKIFYAKGPGRINLNTLTKRSVNLLFGEKMS